MNEMAAVPPGCCGALLLIAALLVSAFAGGFVMLLGMIAGKRWLRRRRERLKAKKAGELIESEIHNWYGKGL